MHQGDLISLKYIIDVTKYIDVNENAANLNDLNMSYLLYADDIVLLVQSEDDLQKSFNAIELFCKDWGLMVNVEKSKILVFNQIGKLVYQYTIQKY